MQFVVGTPNSDSSNSPLVLTPVSSMAPIYRQGNHSVIILTRYNCREYLSCVSMSFETKNMIIDNDRNEKVVVVVVVVVMRIMDTRHTFVASLINTKH